MSEPSHDAQQVCIHLKWGWLPVVMVRKSYPEDGYSWAWGRWRMARLGEVVHLNSLLMKTWRNGQMSDEELMKRLLDFDKVTVGDARDAALRIEELGGEIAGVERAKDALEGLRPVWAQGWTDDSMAAQASGNALAQLWKMLGVQNQTQAVATLKALTEQLEAARADTKKAVEALRLYACKNECNDGRCHCSGNDCGQHASATLAEIEGEKT